MSWIAMLDPRRLRTPGQWTAAVVLVVGLTVALVAWGLGHRVRVAELEALDVCAEAATSSPDCLTPVVGRFARHASRGRHHQSFQRDPEGSVTGLFRDGHYVGYLGSSGTRHYDDEIDDIPAAYLAVSIAGLVGFGLAMPVLGYLVRRDRTARRPIIRRTGPADDAAGPPGPAGPSPTGP